MVVEAAIRRRFRLIERHLDERLRRLVAAAEVAAAGAGGVSAVARATAAGSRPVPDRKCRTLIAVNGRGTVPCGGRSPVTSRR